MINKPISSRRLLSLFSIVLVFILSVSGCWDQTEIEQRSFVLGIGIDTVSATELEPSQVTEPGLLHPQSDQILITFEIPKTTQLQPSQNQGGSGTDGQQKPAWTPSITGVNLSKAIAEIQLRSNSQFYMGHLLLIAVGDELARQKGLKDILAYFFRDPEVQREIPFFIVNGRAKDLLTLIPPDEKMAAVYLNNVTHIEKFSARLFYTTIGKLAMDLYEDGIALVGRVRPAANEAVSGGIAVIKDWKLAGFLGEVESLGINLLVKRIKRGTITVQLNKNDWYSVRIYSIQREIEPRWNGQELHLRYRFVTEGEVAEVPDARQIALNQKILRNLEKALAQQLKAAAATAIAKLQRDYKADAIGMGEYIRKYRPQIWKQIGSRWREEFPRVKVDIQVEHKLRRMGVSM